MLPAWFYEDRLKGRRQAKVITKQRDPSSISVETWLGGYSYILPEARLDTTAYNDARMVRAFRREYGDRRVSSITVLEAQAWYLKHPSHRKFLRQAWRLAVQMQVAPLDIWAQLVAPRRTKPRPSAPSPEVLAEISTRCLSFSKGDRYSWWVSFDDFITVAAYTGARRGGMVGLGRADVDMEGRRITVTEKGGKTRKLLLAGPAEVAMRRQLERREREGWGQEHRGHGHKAMVWLGPMRRPLSGETVQQKWRKVRGDFPHGIHSLKHYAARWFAEHGASDEDIAIQLGHTDEQGRPYVELVREVYHEPDPDLALRRLEAHIQPTTGEP